MKLPLHDYGLTAELNMHRHAERGLPGETHLNVNLYDCEHAYKAFRGSKAKGHLLLGACLSEFGSDALREGLGAELTSKVASWAFLCDEVLGAYPLRALQRAAVLVCGLSCGTLTAGQMQATYPYVGATVATHLGWVRIEDGLPVLNVWDFDEMLRATKRRHNPTGDPYGFALFQRLWSEANARHTAGPHQMASTQ